MQNQKRKTFSVEEPGRGDPFSGPSEGEGAEKYVALVGFSPEDKERALGGFMLYYRNRSAAGYLRLLLLLFTSPVQADPLLPSRGDSDEELGPGERSGWGGGHALAPRPQHQAGLQPELETLCVAGAPPVRDRGALLLELREPRRQGDAAPDARADRGRVFLAAVQPLHQVAPRQVLGPQQAHPQVLVLPHEPRPQLQLVSGAGGVPGAVRGHHGYA